MITNRVWEMPNKNTFDIRCIKQIIDKYNRPELVSVDPFANKNRIATITNDLDPSMGTTHNMDAIDFLRSLDANSVDMVLFDPPYSPRQISECYKKLGKSVNMETTQSSFWANMKAEIGRITRLDGIVLSFGWNSGGIGKKYGFDILEILLVAHGGAHNDTICVVDRKVAKTNNLTQITIL